MPEFWVPSHSTSGGVARGKPPLKFRTFPLFNVAGWLSSITVVQMATGYTNYAFLVGCKVEDVYNTFILCRATVFPAYLDIMRLDQGGQFKFMRWERQTAVQGITINPTEFKSHNSLAFREQYHAPLHRLYETLYMTNRLYLSICQFSSLTNLLMALLVRPYLYQIYSFMECFLDFPLPHTTSRITGPVLAL